MGEYNLNQIHNTSGKEQFNIREFLLRLIRLWPLGMASLVICIAGAYFYLRFRTPDYHINAKLLIEDEKKTGASTAGQVLDLGGLLGARSSVDNESEVLSTRFLMEQLVRDMELFVTWYDKGTFRDVEFDKAPYEFIAEEFADSVKTTDIDFVQLSSDQFQLEYVDPSSKETVVSKFRFGQSFELPRFGRFQVLRNARSPTTTNERHIYGLKISSVDAVVSAFRSLLTIELTNKAASTIALTFDYPVPAKGERILNGYIKEYINQNIKDKNRIADSTIAFIDERILLVNAELNSIEGNIQGFMQNSGLANISEQSKLLLGTSTEYVKQLADLETRIQMLDAVQKQLQGDSAARIVAGAALADDPTFNELVTRYNTLNLDRERLLLSYTADNPVVRNADGRIASVRQDVLGYIKSARSNLEVNRRELEKSTTALQGNIRQVPAQERAFLDLSRQQQIKQELYVFLLQKREETAVAKTSNIAGIRIIDPPKSEVSPFSPNSVVVFAVAIFFALAIPLGWIYAQDLLDTKVQSRRDVEKRTQVPIVGEIAHNPEEKDLVAFNASRSAIAEQFRGLRTNMQFLLGGSKGGKVVLVTSSQPGEGKSFISLNLARVQAVSGKNVLLLEFDLRKPKLSAVFNTYGRTGLTNYLVNPDGDYHKLLIQGGDFEESLWFLPSGPIPPNPSELILSGQLDQFFAAVRDEFDLIIVDAPPIGAVTDAQLLSAYSDVCLYLVRCGITPHDLLALPEELRVTQRIKNVGIVLNDISEHAPGYYGYGYYYHEGKRRTWWEKLLGKK